MKTVLGAVLGLTLMVPSVVAAQDAAKPKPKMAGPEIMLMKPAAVKSGDNQFEVMVKGADGKPIKDADVSILFVMPKTATMAEMRNEVKLKPSGDGMYMGMGNVGMSGKWTVTISAKQGSKEIGQKKLTLTAK